MKKTGLSSILIAVTLLTVVVIAEAQQATKVHRIGYLTGVSLSAMAARTESFRQGLRELGYVGEKTLSLSGDLRKGKRIAFLRSRPSSCVSREADRSHNPAECAGQGG